MRLSVLDLVPVRAGQSSADALAATIRLARLADRLGYERYWLAEHHNMEAVAATNPPVLAALVAASTERIRVGSGGVMLPNHAPLVVAEQFALLEAYAPGRIDLGLGRAPGSDPVTSVLLRGGGAGSDAERFPEHVADILALLDPRGTAFRLPNGEAYVVHATPVARSMPTVWLLGSSDFSAQLAARMGLPYVFANHFGGEGLDRALELYRSGFQPSEYADAPVTILTANVVVADTADEAAAIARPALLSQAKLFTAGRPQPLATIEQAAAMTPTETEAPVVQRLATRWIIDDGPGARARLAALAAQHGIDEVMVSPTGGAHDGDPMDASPARERAIELLAA